MTWRSLAVAVVLAGLAGSISLPAQDPIRADADSMQRKLLAIAARSELKPAQRPAPVRTTFTEREVNAYFKVNATDVVPTGIVNPQLSIDEGGRVRAKALVDLQAAVKPRERSWLDPLAWVPPGQIEVTAAGVIQAAEGKARVAIESATLGGVPVSKSVLQELVAYYSRTPEHPAGVNLDEPFELPANIRAVETRRGTATVVQ
jgi:hypothetical protein